MTQDQKKLLHALGVLIAFKAVLYTSIHYAAKTAREANNQNQKQLSEISR